ncbi:VPLPA-CTERM sorting domain-containing protein [Rubellimicrobium roseum]|uniref:VPLPA-CTERM sorting domain-containing protein n=1 Tax=Rubellimicrobium roseum TaxID=687525 RepID=A0A5C4NB78_9RHOB|nr:VPLPA-CTERM sorting domain-containing protein [Rubellimicrobium roseum]TNC70689.1 VPLPA-CTERM sorting domain-containing protein [Rubellimicrobium roseum]
MGYGAIVDFTFGPESHSLFTGFLKISEVTFNNRATSALESVDVWGGRKGVFVKLGTLTNRAAVGELALDGVFDTLRLADTTFVPRGSSSGGYDVDQIAVAAVPVPAAGFLLLSGLAGFSVLRRRRQDVSTLPR